MNQTTLERRIPIEVQTAAHGLLAPYGVDLDGLLARPQVGPPPPRLFTLADTAMILSCSKRHLHRLIRRGKLPVVHLGRRSSRIPEDAVIRLVSGATVIGKVQIDNDEKGERNDG